MSFKETKLYSIGNAKCPKCHEGDFFETRNPYNLKRFDKMHENCSVCGQSFEMETGFYYGAMYVSYGTTVAFGVLVYTIMCVLFNFEDLTFIFTFALLQLLLMPLFYRISRLVWINMFVKYEKKP